MATRESRLEAERLSIMQNSRSGRRDRSTSPALSRHHSRSSSTLTEENQKDLKWSVVSHDPLERFIKNNGDKKETQLWDDEISDEEHISDDDNNEKLRYDDTGNILPNYACHDDQIHEISKILVNSNLNDVSTISKLEELTANERALANTKFIGKDVDENLLNKIASDKRKLTGDDRLDLNTSDFDAAERKQRLENYAEYRKKVIELESEGSGPLDDSKDTLANRKDSSDDEQDFMAPYTSAVEDKLDREFASRLNETIQEGEVDSNLSKSRVIQTITRGKFFQLINPKVKPKMFLVCMDFSPESIFALEWALGTVLVDLSVLFIVCVVEESDNNHSLKTNGSSENVRENQRLEMLNKAKQQVLNLLKLTKLQIHIVIEVIHHPIPRHLILEVIDNLQPTLVVVGSKGQSALRGVLLGSLSNYLVTKLSVPVMVVRAKLKKISRFKTGSSIFANNIKPLTLSEARID